MTTRPPFKWIPFLACALPAVGTLVGMTIYSWDKGAVFWILLVLSALVAGILGYAVYDHHTRRSR